MRKDLDFSKFKILLEDTRTTLQQRLEQETSSLSTYSNSPPDNLDAAAKLIQQGRSVSWINYYSGRQVQIEQALLRIETGQFGICARCRNDINLDRLEAKPYARYCVRCQKKIEQR